MQSLKHKAVLWQLRDSFIPLLEKICNLDTVLATGVWVAVNIHGVHKVIKSCIIPHQENPKCENKIYTLPFSRKMSLPTGSWSKKTRHMRKNAGRESEIQRRFNLKEKKERKRTHSKSNRSLIVEARNPKWCVWDRELNSKAVLSSHPMPFWAQVAGQNRGSALPLISSTGRWEMPFYPPSLVITRG